MTFQSSSNQHAIEVHLKRVFFYPYSMYLSHSSSISFLFKHYSFQLHIYISILNIDEIFFPHSNILLYVIGLRDGYIPQLDAAQPTRMIQVFINH